MSSRAASFLGTLSLSLLTFGCSGGTSTDDGVGDEPPFTGASFLGATQDRDVDPTGRTLFVEFDGAMNTQDLETLSNYTVSGAVVQSASQVEPNEVQLTLNVPAVPGDALLTIAPGMRDATGDLSAGTSLSELVSTDTTAPTAASISGVAVSGINNDSATITFSDCMVAEDVERVSSWNIESPLGTPLDLDRAVVTYDADSLSATLTFGGGQNLTTGAELSAVLTTMRDIGGNTIEATAFGAGAVQTEVGGDTQAPQLLSVFPGETPGTLVYVFDEPVQFVETADLIASVPVSGTRFTFTEASAPGVLITADSSISVINELAAEVAFSVAPEVGDTASVFGVVDLAGNPMLPAVDFTVEVRNPNGPDLFMGSTELIAVEGERNDILRVTFDTDMHPSRLFDFQAYGLLLGFFVDTMGAKPSFDGAREVTFLLRGPTDHDIQTASTYILAAALTSSRQGVLINGTTQESGVIPTGDSAAPTLTSARIAPLSATGLIVEFSEALKESSSLVNARYTLDGAEATSTTLISPRVIALEFAQPPSIGQTLTVAATALEDRAGNSAASSADVAVQAADSSAPNVTGVTATAVSGSASDLVVITFNELIDPSSVADPSTLSVTVGGSTVSLAGSELFYQSSANTLTAELPSTLKLPFGQALTLNVGEIADPSGNAAQAAPVPAMVGGDSVAPTGLAAFVNYRVSTSGNVIEVTPNESLRAEASGADSWFASGGQTIEAVEAIGLERLRVTLDAPLGASETLTLTGATDLAGNISGAALVVDPME